MLDIESLTETTSLNYRTQQSESLPVIYLEVNSWQHDLEAFHSDGGAVEVEE